MLIACSRQALMRKAPIGTNCRFITSILGMLVSSRRLRRCFSAVSSLSLYTRSHVRLTRCFIHPRFEHLSSQALLHSRVDRPLHEAAILPAGRLVAHCPDSLGHHTFSVRLVTTGSSASLALFSKEDTQKQKQD